MTQADWNIGRAETADSKQLLRLIGEHARYEQGKASLSLEQLQGVLAAKSSPVSILVAKGPSGLLGYAAVTFDYSLWRGAIWAHLDCLFVRAEMRGKRIGAALLDAANTLAREGRADRLEWQTPAWNQRAAAFYEREGASIEPKLRFTLHLASAGSPNQALCNL